MYNLLSNEWIQKGSKNMSFKIKDDDVLDKYNEISNKIKRESNIKFHSMPVQDEKYIKTKVRKFNSVTKANFLSNEVTKENLTLAEPV